MGYGYQQILTSIYMFWGAANTVLVDQHFGRDVTIPCVDMALKATKSNPDYGCNPICVLVFEQNQKQAAANSSFGFLD